MLFQHVYDTYCMFTEYEVLIKLIKQKRSVVYAKLLINEHNGLKIILRNPYYCLRFCVKIIMMIKISSLNVKLFLLQCCATKSGHC